MRARNWYLPIRPVPYFCENRYMTSSYSFLVPGTLAERITQQSRFALAQGALQPLPTESHYYCQDHLQFLVRILCPKQRPTKPQNKGSKLSNPFLPYDRQLWVTDLSPSHLVLLNKYNAVDRHILIITREFEPQESLLTLQDFQAAWQVLTEEAGLVFYNSGSEAGASQSHRHLQWVPFPLGNGEEDFPLAPLVIQILQADSPEAAPHCPFRQALMALPTIYPGDKWMAHHLWVSYQELLHRLLWLPDAASPPLAYNLLLTRTFLMVIPRSQASYQGIHINSLGFAGALLVRDWGHFERLKEIGPLNLLKEVGLGCSFR